MPARQSLLTVRRGQELISVYDRGCAERLLFGTNGAVPEPLATQKNDKLF